MVATAPNASPPPHAGWWVSTADPAIDARRQAVLARRTWYPPAGPDPVTVTRSALRTAGAALVPLLADHGMVTIDVADGPLVPQELVDLAAVFGEPLPEDDPDVQPFVGSGAVLELATVVRAPLPSLQPFSRGWLSLHTEGSRRPSARRPRFVLFCCLVPPFRDHGGQTLLHRTSRVLHALSPRSETVLRGTVLGPGAGDTAIVSGHGPSATITFRDPVPDAVPWTSAFEGPEVEAALGELLAAVYDQRHVHGVHWRRHRLVVLDNARFLHGRSASDGGRRVLQRVRVRGLAGPGDDPSTPRRQDREEVARG